MRHRNDHKKLSRSPAHRRALMRNLATALILRDRIETTLPKAKELRRVADKLVTLGKRNTLHTRRQAMAYLFAQNRESIGDEKKLTPVHKLFSEIAPRYKDRDGGYTRVIRTRKRLGDRAQLAVIEFVESSIAPKDSKRKRRVVRKSETSADASVDTAVSAEN